VHWVSLVPEWLERELTRLGYELTSDEIDEVVADIEEEERQHRRRLRPSGDMIARCLQITAAERDAAEARNLGAVDQAWEDRRAAAADREREADRARKRESRRKRGAKSREEYLAAAEARKAARKALCVKFGIDDRTLSRWIAKADPRVASLSATCAAVRSPSGNVAHVRSPSGDPSYTIEDNRQDGTKRREAA
jgi:MoxR-like ATPase